MDIDNFSSVKLYKSLGSIQFLSTTEDLQFIRRVLHLDHRCTLPWRPLNETDEFGFGMLATLGVFSPSSFLLPHNAPCVFLLVSERIQMDKEFKWIKPSIHLECIDCYGCILLPLQKLPEDKEVCIQEWVGGTLVLLPNSPSFSQFTVVHRACAKPLWDILCHLVEFHWKRIIWGVSYQTAGYTPEPFSRCLISPV